MYREIDPKLIYHVYHLMMDFDHEYIPKELESLGLGVLLNHHHLHLLFLQLQRETMNRKLYH
jgi:hypothetical protein